MTLYLKNKKNQITLDLDLWIKTEDSISFIEIRSSVNISNYSQMLIKISDSKIQQEMIKDFDELSNLRCWLWEVYFMKGENNPEEFDKVLIELKEILKTFAEKYDLFIVQD